MQISDGSVVNFQKTAVAVVASLVVFFEKRGCGFNAIVQKLTTAVVVITYNFNITKYWRKSIQNNMN